jgi:hypothetical protein
MGAQNKDIVDSFNFFFQFYIVFFLRCHCYREYPVPTKYLVCNNQRQRHGAKKSIENFLEFLYVGISERQV